jgi:hypothetical protein
MIDGLKVTIKGSELKELCLKQSQYHRNRADALQKQIDAGVAEDDPSCSNFRRDAGQRKKNEMESASLMRFAAEHFDATAEYLVAFSDLSNIGVERSMW